MEAAALFILTAFAVIGLIALVVIAIVVWAFRFVLQSLPRSNPDAAASSSSSPVRAGPLLTAAELAAAARRRDQVERPALDAVLGIRSPAPELRKPSCGLCARLRGIFSLSPHAR